MKIYILPPLCIKLNIGFYYVFLEELLHKNNSFVSYQVIYYQALVTIFLL